VKRRLAAAALFWAVLQSGSGAEPPQIEAAFFPYAGGWVGGDAAYSTPLNAQTTVWFFGDTFVQKREESTMIHNSIAVRTCKPDCTISYWWKGMNTKKPDAFFATPETNYFWPLDSFVEGGRLYVFLEQMHTSGDGGPMGFDYSGVKLAIVENPYDAPSSWRISYRDVAKGNQVIPGIAAVRDTPAEKDYVFVLTLLRQNPREPFLALQRASLRDLPSNLKWEYLTDSGTWTGWDGSKVPAHAARLLNGNITEMSVKFHSDRGKWLAVFPTPGYLSNTASFSTAEKMEGPWTVPQTLFHYPEMTAADKRHTPQVFCYAAKEHPELEKAGRIAFTYACNSMKEPEIFRDWELYRPQLVRMALPAH
jgi:hypothetical protein